MKNLIAIALLASFVVGCGDSAEPSKTETSTPPTPETSMKPETKPEAKPAAERPATDPTAAPGATLPPDGDEVAVMTTNLGTIVLRFFSDKAPHHVENFKKLAGQGFYDGTKFHRVIPGFMIQGGDPNSKDSDRSDDGMGGPGYQIDAEFNERQHTRGILSMARSQDPNSAGSQFFITVDSRPDLDGSYTVFGQVIKGMDVVDKIVNLKRDGNDNPLPANPATIESVKIEKWPIK